jgi:hypothetical protein
MEVGDCGTFQTMLVVFTLLRCSRDAIGKAIVKKILLSVLLCTLSGLFNSCLFGSETKILTNHLGYESSGRSTRSFLG